MRTMIAWSNSGNGSKTTRCRRVTVAAAAAAVCLQTFTSVCAQAAPPERSITVDPDLTAHIQNVTLPQSGILSNEAKEVYKRLARPTEGPGAMQIPQDVPMAERRRLMNEGLQPNVNHMRELFPVDIEETTIDGIAVAIITPKGGVPAKNKNRLMINAPGGGFITGIRANSLLISIPVSAVGQFKVVSLLYRQYPEYRFPAATEDFTKVYKAMLKDYKPKNIGLVGCSAGGVLVAESVASFQKQGLPAPGVLGIYCAGANAKFGNGDSAVFATLGTAALGPAAPAAGSSLGYFEGMNLDDPAISPDADLSIVAKFPPTIFATGTRDFAMSSAAYSHRRLVKADVESDLLIYDGLHHGFMTNPDFPESRDLYEITAKFYDKHLGR